MKIVIDISAEDFENVKCGRGAVSMMRKAIIHGTPLPDTNAGDFKQAVLDAVMTECSLIVFDSYGNLTFTGERIIEAIKGVPSVEPERKKGKWIRAIDPDVNAWTGGHTCSECGRACVQMSMNYCANCGAKMKGEHT